MKTSVVVAALVSSYCALGAPTSSTTDAPLQAGPSNSTGESTSRLGNLLKATFRIPGKVSLKDHSYSHVVLDGTGLESVDDLEVKETVSAANGPELSFRLASSRHRVSPLPFAESSFMREETNLIEPDPEPTMLEMETQASRESHQWIPCLKDGKLHFHRVAKKPDQLAFSLILLIMGVAAVVCLGQRIRQRINQYKHGKGAIFLKDDGMFKRDVKDIRDLEDPESTAACEA
ncbi:hypothetical protein F4778DRAFT_404015 [Xylariomycetidae sp. FL2044]|nr:hypothetical protein F4778DRAFT_404015 [Xylariomycetidae sp. FL2044]